MTNVNIDELIFDFAYELAMRDATMRTAFTGESIYALLGKDDPSASKQDNDRKTTQDTIDIANEAKGAVKEYTDAILGGFGSEEEHDVTFYEAAKKITEAFQSCVPTDEMLEAYPENKREAKRLEKTFTFGNAQKLLNMTAKYIFISTYRHPCLREKFNFCHCPMDGRMMKKAGLNGQIAWSKLEWTPGKEGAKDGAPKEYRTFQAKIKKLADEQGFNSIEYDFDVWANQ